MKKIKSLNVAMAIALLLFLGSCSKNTDKNITQPEQSEVLTEEMMSENGSNPDEASIRENAAGANSELNAPSRRGQGSGHYLYTESNEASANSIVAYKIMRDGSLHHAGNTISGGAGTGKILGSQGALVLDKDHEWLFAVNAGSNSVSSFKVHGDGSLELAYTESTDGLTPVSVTVHGKLLYVLNRGSDNIHGFRVAGNGKLIHIKGSTQALSSTGVDAPQISFSPDGEFVIVTEKATNIIGTFKVKSNGLVSSGLFTPSVGPTPFGFEFSRSRFMIVSNAAGGGAMAGSATSYVIGSNGVPKDINGAVPNFESAPCWFAVTKYGRFAYTTNTASNNISSYYIAPWGALYLVQKEAATTGMAPLDIVVAANNYFVYELNGKSSTIGGYHRKFFGGLELIGNTANVPASATGLATY